MGRRRSDSSLVFLQAWLQCPRGSHSSGAGPGAAPVPESLAVSVPACGVCRASGRGSSGSTWGQGPHRLGCPAFRKLAWTEAGCPSPACSAPASDLGSLVLALPQPLCAHGQGPAPLSLSVLTYKRTAATPRSVALSPARGERGGSQGAGGAKRRAAGVHAHCSPWGRDPICYTPRHQSRAGAVWRACLANT